MSAPAIRHERVDVGELSLNVAMAGPADGRRIVFLHGFPEFWYAWRRQLASFGDDGWLAVAPDLRGYNLSDRPDGVAAYTTRHLVADIAGLLRHLGPEPAILVGHDWGGIVAWATAIRLPELVARLVILNAPHPAIFARLLADDPAQQRASGYINRYRRPGAEISLVAEDCRVLRESMTEPWLRAGLIGPEDAAAYLETWRRPGALRAALNYYRAMRMAPPGRDGSPAVVRDPDPARLVVRPPTLVVWGLRDRFLVPQNLDGLEAFVPDLTVCRLADAGHWLVHEEGPRIEAAIREFAL